MNAADRSSIYFKFFLLWASISSILILLLIKLGVESKYVFALKDAPLYFVMVLVSYRFLSEQRLVLVLVGATVFLLSLTLNYVALNYGYPAPLANIRQIISPIVILLFFCSLGIGSGGVLAVESFLKFIVVFVFSFGVFEVFFELWKAVDLSRFFTLKGIPVDEHGLSYMFYEPIIGYRERMTSTFLDPISLGHFFSAVLIYFYYFDVRHRPVMLAVSFVGLVFCFSKGAMLQAFLALTVMNFRVNFLVRAVCCLVPFIVFFAIPNKTGILIHLNGLLNAISSVTFLGYGIGSSGNYAKMFSEDLSVYNALGISDTFAGALLGQVGFLGFLVWILLLFAVIYPFKRKGNVDFVILGSMVVISVISENTMNVTSFMVPAMLVALAYRRKLNFG